MKSMREKRNHYRQKLDLEVKYSVSDFHYNGKLNDISPGGMFISSFDAFSIGKEILLSIKMPNCSTSFKINGNITRKEEKGFGVKFKEPMNALSFHENAVAVDLQTKL